MYKGTLNLYIKTPKLNDLFDIIDKHSFDIECNTSKFNIKILAHIRIPNLYYDNEKHVFENSEYVMTMHLDDLPISSEQKALKAYALTKFDLYPDFYNKYCDYYHLICYIGINDRYIDEHKVKVYTRAKNAIQSFILDLAPYRNSTMHPLNCLDDYIKSNNDDTKLEFFWDLKDRDEFKFFTKHCPSCPNRYGGIGKECNNFDICKRIFNLTKGEEDNSNG
ncbi:MAG: hypothetical protein IKR19_07885 [Acholeplasmatales bacterium]|nr:hypothetical protein [Acholeplasmatales bacterium]